MRQWAHVVWIAVLPLMAMSVRGGSADVATLRKQVDAIDAETNDLQARLTAVERTRSQYAGQPTVGAGPGGTSVLRAPFEVQDDKGKPILRVVERGVASRGLYIFNEKGNVAAQMAVMPEGGGRVYLYPGNEPFGGITTPAFAAIAYSAKGPVLEMTRPDGNEMATISTEGFQAYNKRGANVATLGATPGSGNGFLQLHEPSGKGSIVDAGILPDGRGVVRTYPLGGKPPIPIPNLLMGARAK